jgi:hypothetical protein
MEYGKNYGKYWTVGLLIAGITGLVGFLINKGIIMHKK